jgi:endonuclease/exonuclease/phosphatase family metal-dependent hydrolase
VVIFRIMTWNVENLYSVGSEFAPDTLAEYRQKLESLASVILNLDPDVLALQEIGDLDAFNDLLELLEGRYPYTSVSAYPDSRGIRVGFLSKLAIQENEDFVDFPSSGISSVISQDESGNPTEITRLGRGALRILVEPEPGTFIHLINAHLKSKLLTFPSTGGRSRFTPRDENERTRAAGLALLRRTAEAAALRVRANELLENNTEQGLIVLGDMNDEASAATTQILQGPGGSEIGTPGFDRSDRGDDARLFNLAPLIPEQRRYSRIYQGRGELIDHILVSEELLPRQSGLPNGSRQLPEEVDSHVDIVGGELPSIGDDPSRRRREPSSDHAPVTATFDL